MARVPQNRQSQIIHRCPICGKKSVPHEGPASEATEALVENGWSWTSALDGGAWHLVCQLHRKPGKPQTLFIDTTRPPSRQEKYDPENHGQRC